MKETGELRIANKEAVGTALKQAASNADRLVLVTVLVLIFLAAARTPVDTDLWWHLRAGEATWTEGQPLLHDPFSFTRLGQLWINHSWLSQVGMFLLFEWGGYLALGTAVALLAAGMMALVYFQQEGPALLRAFLLILGSAAAAVVWTPRPQTVSLFLFALTGYVLYLYKWRQRDMVWLLVPLFVVWSNLHGGYPLGLMAIGAVIVGEGLNHAVGNRGPEVLHWRQVRKLVLIGLLCAAAVAINPNGIGTWLIPFQTVGVTVLQNFVNEWASPDFHEFAQQPLLWLMFALLGAVGLSGRRIDGSDLAAVIVFGMLAFIARRNFGPFALVAVPVLSRHLWVVIQHLRARVKAPAGDQEGEQKDTARVSRWKKVVNLTLVAFLALIGFGKLYFVTHPAFVEAHLRTTYPAEAVAWMQAQGLDGNLFSEYGWGGYLVWNLRTNPVFVDGRTDLFGDEIVGEWITVVQAGEGWAAILEQRQVDLVLLDPARPVTSLLSENGWEELYWDGQAVLFRRGWGH
jgi:hypothetical protein